VYGMLCAAIGASMVTEAVKLITGVGRTLLGRVQLYDALRATWRELKVSKDPEVEPITELVDYEAFCGVAPAPAPSTGRTVTAVQLAQMLREREAGLTDFELVDVREPGEHAMVSIPGSRLIPQGRLLSGEAWGELPQEKDVVFHCKSGVRSANVLAAAEAAGFTAVRHLDGGVLAWVRDVEPDKPTY
ncbi:MAG: adenylyltransferase/sulfurtransferase MoeZ, partial [Sinomonas sp.]|nr:adenylyltransferase/sulfurtransferase MoeZ [Sinomonas sp.]